MLAKIRKLESDVSSLQDKVDSLEDEALVNKEFSGRKTEETSRPTGNKYFSEIYLSHAVATTHLCIKQALKSRSGQKLMLYTHLVHRKFITNE